MVLDYSRFDNIEISDDSDIEVHPNIDKKSMIRWKQRDIHEKREQAKAQMTHYRTEVEMNKELISRVDRMMTALKTQTSEPPATVTSSVMQSFPKEEGTGPRNGPTYNEMMESLLKQIDTEVKAIRDEDKASSITHKLSMHRDKLLNVITSRETQIGKLEQEQQAKITSDGIRDGWNHSGISKLTPEVPIKESVLKTHPPKSASKDKGKGKVQAIETLNPNATMSDIANDENTEAGYETDSDIDADGLPDHIEPTPMGRQFGAIPIGKYDECLQFLGKNPNIIRDETETDGLLIDAYYAEIKNEHVKAKQNIHQGLLLQYCRQLGKDGVSMFFHRIKDKKHRAYILFADDVESTYARIKSRAEEARAEEEAIAKQDPNEPVEQIQLHAVDPGTKIGINVPPPNHNNPDIQECRKIFESFSPGLQRALETGKLDAINKVLGKMAVEEAEEIVELLSRGGMLAIEEEILDGTDPNFVMPDRARSTVAESTDVVGESADTPSTATGEGPEFVSAIDDID